MIEHLKECYKYRDLLKQLVVRDLKVRYKNSVLGFFWSLANPLVQVATITIVIKYVMRLEIPNYSAYLLVGFMPWIFFFNALMDSSQVILHHRDLLRKVYFPREVLPLSVVLANLIHFLLAMVVLFAYLFFYIHLVLGGTWILPSIILLPGLIAIQCLLIIGITFFISTMNVFYEDTKYLLQAFLGVLFYLTPVMYPAELVYTRFPEAYRTILFKLYMLNPVNTITEAYRKILLPAFEGGVRGVEVHGLPLDYGMLAVAGGISLIVAVLGYRFFNLRKWIFAERV